MKILRGDLWTALSLWNGEISWLYMGVIEFLEMLRRSCVKGLGDEVMEQALVVLNKDEVDSEETEVCSLSPVFLVSRRQTFL